MIRHFGQQGFTLTELIMVIVIIGVLSAVAMPMWFSAGDFEERGYYDEVIQAARYAQKVAVVSNCDVRFSLGAGGFSLEIQNSPFTHCAVQTVDLPGQSGPYTKPGGVASDTASITFAPAGTASADATLNIGGRQIQIHAATGYVERL